MCRVVVRIVGCRGTCELFGCEGGILDGVEIGWVFGDKIGRGERFGVWFWVWVGGWDGEGDRLV